MNLRALTPAAVQSRSSDANLGVRAQGMTVKSGLRAGGVNYDVSGWGSYKGVYLGVKY